VVLTRLATFCESSDRFDYIVSSLDDNLFDNFSSTSGRRINHIPLPLITTENSKRLYYDALQYDVPNIPREIDDRFKLLCKLVGHLPRHISACAKVLYANRGNVSFYLDSASQHVENTKAFISFVSEHVQIPPLKSHYQWDNILCHVLLVIFSVCLAKRPVYLYLPFVSAGGTALKITNLELANNGIFTASTNNGEECTLAPCMLVLSLLVKQREFLKEYNIHSLLLRMLELDIFSADGIQNEQFHLLWVRIKVSILHALYTLESPEGRSEISLGELYDLESPFPLPGFPKENIVTTEELKTMMIGVFPYPTDTFVVDPSHFDLWLSAGQPPSFIKCPAGQRAFEGAYISIVKKERVLVLIQDKVSGPSTTYSIQDIAECCRSISEIH